MVSDTWRKSSNVICFPSAIVCFMIYPWKEADGSLISTIC